MQSCRRRGAWSNDEQSWAKQKGWGYWGAGLQPAVEVVMELSIWVKLSICVIGVNFLV